MGTIAMSEEFFNPTNIKVVGVGGAGCNTVNRMIENGFYGVDFIALNTDVQSINMSQANHKIQIGAQLTKGLGTGANIELGREAAIESKDAIKEALIGAHLLFITSGMGGGTGTGATPVVAEIAKELGILTICFVTSPFFFEGRKRMLQAQEGIKRVKTCVDSLLVIQNQKLVDVGDDKNISLMGAFEKVDEILVQGIQGLTDIINKTGIVNVDFADVRVIMQDAGFTLMGLGRSGGKDRALQAVKNALTNPLLDLDIKGASGILVNIAAGKTLTLSEYQQVVEFVSSQASSDAHIIAGAYIDEDYAEQISVTVIATKFMYDEELIKRFCELEVDKTKSVFSSSSLPSQESVDEVESESSQEDDKQNSVVTNKLEPIVAQEDSEDTIFGKKMPEQKIGLTLKSYLDRGKQKKENLFISRQDTIKIFDEDFQLGKLDVPAFQRRGI